jgi:hypothetical protein
VAEEAGKTRRIGIMKSKIGILRKNYKKIRNEDVRNSIKKATNRSEPGSSKLVS